MTFTAATRYIYKICASWAWSTSNRFETDELFNEVWIGFNGDLSSFGENYRILGVAVSRRIIEYMKRKDGIPGTVRYLGNRATTRLKNMFPVAGQFNGFTDIENREEWLRLTACLTPKQRMVLDMYYRQGLTQTEIGRWFGTNSAAVSYHLVRAIHKMKVA